MKQFWKILDTLMDWILALGIFAIAAICLAQIIARSILNVSIMWSGEASRYLFVLVVFVGMAVLTRDRNFICMDLIQSKIPARARFAYDMMLQVLLMCYAAVIMIYGYKFAMQNGYQRSSSMHIPMNVLYMLMPISGFSIILYSIRNMVDDFRARFLKGGKEE